MEIARDHDRAFSLRIEAKTLSTPTFFPAVSSCCNLFPVLDCLRVLATVGHPKFLASAYDIFHARTKMERKEFAKLLRRCGERGSIILLDSGNYEARCSDDRTWTFHKLDAVLREVSPEVCFSFDALPERRHSVRLNVDRTISSVARTAGSQRSGITVPIVHADRKALPRMVKDVAEGINAQVVAVTERELGQDILERASEIRLIRRALDRTGRDIPLHVLGTSDPVSILAYSLVGADSFDGLDWTRRFVEPSSGILRDFSHGILVRCDCRACKNRKLRYELRAMLHNLIFYEAFMDHVRMSILDGRGRSLLERHGGKLAAEKILGAAARE